MLPRRAVTSSQNRAYCPTVSVRWMYCPASPPPPSSHWKSHSTRPLGSVTTTRAPPREPSSSSTVRAAPSAVRASGPVARAEARMEAWLVMDVSLER